MNRKFLSSLCLSFMFFQLYTALPIIDDFWAVANVLIGNVSNEDKRNNEDTGTEANIQNADDGENNDYEENDEKQESLEDDVGESEEREENDQNNDEDDTHGENDVMTLFKQIFENNTNEERNKDEEGTKTVETTEKDEIQNEELNVLQQLISDIGVGTKKCQGGCSFGTICVNEKCEKLNILT